MGVVWISVDSRRYENVDSEMSARGYLHLIPRGEGDREVLHRLPPGMYWTPELTMAADLLRDALEATASETGVRIVAVSGHAAWSGLPSIDDG